MEVYIILTVLVLSLVPFAESNERFIAIPFFVLALFSGFRHDVGIDYKAYVDIFAWGIEGSNVTKEPLFIYLIKFCDLIGGDYQLMFLILAFLTNYFVYRCVIKNSTDVILSFLLYFSIVSFYLFTFNAVRQWVACSLFLYSLTYLFEKRYYSFVILNTVTALFFHLSLIFLIPVSLLCTFNLSGKLRWVMLISSIALALFVKVILSNTLYGNYMSNENAFDSSVDSKIYLFLLINIGIDFIKDKYPPSFFSKILFNINYVSILLLILIIVQQSGTLVLLLKRFHNYFLATYIIIIPFLLSIYHPSIRGLISLILYVILPILFLLTVFVFANNLILLPFHFNFNLFK